MVYRLIGDWELGLAFDLHTVTSTYLGPNQFGHDQFDNTRSEMGELLYQLKYQNDTSVISTIIELLKAIKGIENFDCIIPVPSSKLRHFQPVDAIATALGEQRGVHVLLGYLEKESSNTEIKSVTDPEQRVELLKGVIRIVGEDGKLLGKTVLLVDDLYRSGATLNACCRILKEKAGVASVSVLTMTKTRSKR